jgi:xanthine dehydrogenase large subunit
MSHGHPLPHDAAHLHVTGAARYVDDLPCPANCLHLGVWAFQHCLGTDHRSQLRSGARP